MSQTNSLLDAWNALKADNPSLRIRNAAKALGVSEVQLLALQVGNGVTRLRPDCKQILLGIEKLGYVMALTRNDDCVHERKGVYLNPELDSPHAGVFVSDDIDLRLFLSAWASAWAVTEMSRGKERYSLQFFGKDGEAVHKIYLTDKSDKSAYDALVAEFTAPEQNAEVTIEPGRPTPPEKPDADVDVAGFQNEWINLKDTHDFFMMMRKYGVSRTQALRLAPAGDYAQQSDNQTLRRVFQAAAAAELPIMVFVGNKGMIQIHTGTIKNLVDHEEWFNVLDPEFNLHLKEGSIASTWIVRKPTVDGMVTSIECFDAKGELIVQIFGKRKPGIPELEKWREIVAQEAGFATA